MTFEGMIAASVVGDVHRICKVVLYNGIGGDIMYYSYIAMLQLLA